MIINVKKLNSPANPQNDRREIVVNAIFGAFVMTQFRRLCLFVRVSRERASGNFGRETSALKVFINLMIRLFNVTVKCRSCNENKRRRENYLKSRLNFHVTMSDQRILKLTNFLFHLFRRFSESQGGNVRQLLKNLFRFS